MKKLVVIIVINCLIGGLAAQPAKTEMYELIKKLLYDSTGYENVGDWSVGSSKNFPVTWKTDHIEMSDDTSINFFWLGSASITVKGRQYMQAGKPIKWSIMLKGPRMGYTNFSIISGGSPEISSRFNIDSVFGQKPFSARLLKTCETRGVAGYFYYEVKLPKKDLAYMKFSWISVNGNTALRIDCYDSWSKYAVKLDCPK